VRERFLNRSTQPPLPFEFIIFFIIIITSFTKFMHNERPGWTWMLEMFDYYHFPRDPFAFAFSSCFEHVKTCNNPWIRMWWLSLSLSSFFFSTISDVASTQWAFCAGFLLYLAAFLRVQLHSCAP